MAPRIWRFVMIHHSAGHDGALVDTPGIRRFHTSEPPAGRGWQDIGYHFTCERIGDGYEVLAGRPLSLDGAHCPGMNSQAVGLCLIGNFMDAAPPEEQLRTAARFVAGLCAVLGISSSAVTMHKNHRDTDCPGAKFDLKRFRALVERYHL